MNIFKINSVGGFHTTFCALRKLIRHLNTLCNYVTDTGSLENIAQFNDVLPNTWVFGAKKCTLAPYMCSCILLGSHISYPLLSSYIALKYEVPFAVIHE